MTQTPNATSQIQLLDSGYSREARSLLYQAYRHEPTFRFLFNAERSGYEQRVRATVRELVRQHFFQDLPALGLLVNDRLVGIALIAPPQRHPPGHRPARPGDRPDSAACSSNRC